MNNESEYSIWLDPAVRDLAEALFYGPVAIVIGCILLFRSDEASDMIIGRGTFRGLSISSTPGWMLKPFGVLFILGGIYFTVTGIWIFLK